jgi:hypothetical protein
MMAMPIDYSKYHPDWKTKIRPRILERAKHCCEYCGVGNYQIIMRNQDEKSYYLILEDDGIHYAPDGTPVRLSEIPEGYMDSQYIKVILTIAHLDHNITNNADDNLMAMCQRCHLTHDAKDNSRKAAETRRLNHEQKTGQINMFLPEEFNER